jgi:hypothetical protein
LRASLIRLPISFKSGIVIASKYTPFPEFAIFCIDNFSTFCYIITVIA